MNWIVALALLIVGCFPPATVVAPSTEDLADRLADMTVALYDAEEDNVYCSGVWISSEDILTANHCVHGQSTVQYLGRSDVSPTTPSCDAGECTLPHSYVPQTAVVAKVDEDKDLALLHALMPEPHATATLGAEPRMGASVYTMGAPMGQIWSFSAGVVASPRRYVDGDDSPVLYTQVTAPISPGNSGCGLFDAEGRLVGIGRMHMVGQNLNFFVHRDLIEGFIHAP